MKSNILVALLGIALVFTGTYAVTTNGQKAELEEKITAAKMRLTYALSFHSLFYLFDEVIENPTNENREALNSALRNKESQLRTYIVLSLSEEQIDQKFSSEKGNKSLLSYQLSNAKLLNLDTIESDHDETLRQMKEAWEIFKKDTGGSPEFIKSREPIMVADAYIKLANKMEHLYSQLN